MSFIYFFVIIALNINSDANSYLDYQSAYLNGIHYQTVLGSNGSERPFAFLSLAFANEQDEIEPVRAEIDWDRPVVALTFDDGPSYYTKAILDILEYHGVVATFCVVGRLVYDNRDIVYRAYTFGHEIIGHSYNHPNFAIINNDEIARQILDTSAAIRQATGSDVPKIMRPPYGIVTDRVLQVAKEHGYALVNWSIDPRDWYFTCPDYIYAVIRHNIQHGSIILLHDTMPTTVAAVELFLPRLIDDGYQFVTLSELLLHIHGEIVPGNLYR